MPPKPSADSFLSAVRQSGLVEDSQLKKFWQSFEDTGKDPQDTEQIASEFVGSNLLSKWQIDKLLQGKHKGFFLGKYKLISLLGSGGMSAVYLAEHTLMRRRVAIKVLPQSRIEDSSYLERFHREAQAVASLDHPNIMRAYDVDQEGKVHFLVMEYIEGQSLLELVVGKGPVNFVQAADYMRQSAKGLSHAHEEGMIHRDIKPGNILVDKRGVVKILDMGLAMFFDPTGKDDEEASLTIQHDERVLGTADYLSPEQALNSHNVDVRTDIYSLGCTFYYILTGHPPFPEGSLAQRLLYHQTRQPSPVEKDRPDVPPSLTAILRKMMEKKPEDRYQTATEVHDALFKWLVEFGDAEWREKNSVPAPGSTKSGAPLPVATVVSPIARPVAQPAPPVSPATVKPTTPAAAASAIPQFPQVTPTVARAQPSTPAAANAPPVSQPVPTFEPPISVATAPQPAGQFGDFGSFDPSEFTVTQETNTAIKPSSASTIKQSAKFIANKVAIEKLLQDKRVQMIAGGVVGFLILVLLISFGMSGGGGTAVKKNPARRGGRPVEYVVGGSAKFKTISAALDALRESGGNKSTIKVTGRDVYNEPLSFQDLPSGIRIYADDELGPTIAGSPGPQPLIDIANSRGLIIEGFNLNAEGRDIGIRMSGKMPQAGISRCVLTGFEKQGVEIAGAQGDVTNVVLLDNVTLRLAKPTAVGIAITKGSGSPAFVSIDNCRLLGPMSAGVVIDTNCDDIKITNTIFFKMDAGVRFSGSKLTMKDVGMANITFAMLKQGIVFTSMPSKDSTKLGFLNNLFDQIEGADFVVENGYVPAEFATLSASSGNNWTSKPALDPALVIFSGTGKAAVKPLYVSEEPDSLGFLAPSPMSPQRDAPAIGFADPYVGAVGP